MHINRHKAVVASLATLICSQTWAAGFQLIDQNAGGIGNAYAGSAATAENASTIFYNAAGLTELRNTNISGGLTAVEATCRFHNEASSAGSLAASNTVADGCGAAQIPNAYLSSAITDNIHVGIGIGAPFGLMTKYQSPWIGGAQSIKFDVKTININPTVAMRVNDNVSIGFGLDWQRFKSEYERLLGTFNVPGLASTAGVTASINTSDNAWGWNAGVLFKLSPETRIGISYRSSIDHKAKGDLSLRSDGSATATATMNALNAAGASGAVSVDIKAPDTWILSTSHRLDDRWELLADVSRSGWSSIPRLVIVKADGTIAQTINTDYRDTWRVALGANYQLYDNVKLRVGTAYDQSPTKGATSRFTFMPDNDRIWLSFGAQWLPTKTSALDFGASYIYLQNSKIHNDQSNATNPLLDNGVIDGKYTASAWIYGLQYSVSF